jgi:error-prone DNA polymerase
VVVAAGFTPGEADQLRRAMGAWHRKGAIEPFRDKLLNGMRANGYSLDFAERVFQQIQGFGDYGFPESHAASFALLAYVSAWLKRYYPAAFAAALINSQPMGFYAPAQLVADAKKHGVGVRPIDVNFSDYDCTLEPPELRLGLRMVSGLGQGPAETIMQARADGPFTSFEDLAVRTGLRSGSLKALARADAFGSLLLGRRAALWQSLPPREPSPLFQKPDAEEPPAALPPVAPLEEVLADYGSTGLTLRQHPVSFFRHLLDKLKVIPAELLGTMKSGSRLKVAGIVLLRQRPGTANGITFVTLEDETGTINLIVRLQVWERYRRVARTAVALLAHGRLQREAEVIHVLVTKLEDFSAPLATFDAKSRDFR